METPFWTEVLWWIGVLLGLLTGSLIAWAWFMRRQTNMQVAMAEARAEHATLTQQLNARELAWKGQEQRHEQREAEFLRLTKDYTRLQEGYQHLEARMKERLQEVESMQNHFRLHFQTISQQILDQNAQRLSLEHQDRLQQVLLPLKDRLQAFENRVQQAYEAENRERFSLRQEIEKLVNVNQSIGEEAKNLTRALKGGAKTQGNWGELILARVLESSGLREGQEFLTQGRDMNLRAEDGSLQQPDVIIQLPENKHLLIDAKVSLTAYERFYQEDDEITRQQSLKEHLISIRRHIVQLSEKHYASLAQLKSPDFVFLFLPLEPAFHLAIQEDQTLFSFAWEKKIVLVSPTTLLATLRTVASVWKLERRNQHAEEIARLGGALYDKVALFVEELENVGKHLERAAKAQQDAMNKLKDGRGSLLRRTEQLRDLGVSTKRELPGVEAIEENN